MNLKWGALPIVRVTTWNNFFFFFFKSPICRAEQSSNYWTPALQWLPSPLKPGALYLILSWECHRCRILTFCLWLSPVCGVPKCTYGIKFGYFLLWIFHVDLIIRAAQRYLRIEESFFLHIPSYVIFTTMWHFEHDHPYFEAKLTDSEGEWLAQGLSSESEIRTSDPVLCFFSFYNVSLFVWLQKQHAFIIWKR